MLNETDAGRIRLAWLAVAAGGLLAALSLLYEGRGKPLPAGAAAVVGDQAIGRDQWQRAVQAVEGDRARALDGEERRAVLDRLIDEELLFQHALDSGLVRDDPGLRKTLVAALIDATTAGGAVDEDAARALFARDPAYFAAQPRLAVVAVRTNDAASRDDATAVREVLQDALREGRPLPAGFEPVALPEEPLPLPQIAQRLGGAAASALHRAAAGELLGPFAQGRGALYVLLRQRYADTVRYEDVADAVRSEWQRREAEKALEVLLTELRRDAAIRYASDAR
ncbi:SurA N-terminal domain-containing protein [Sinimarinibacterium flocculans]|uniref:SurA N-terminal domain-containing protein n=1 Tax=Sinimarinibacterium flocculans TaxID=985250 RepID=UPI002490DAE4|nr:SurA N-terminal domain-containing protein [Sinimarinibacterium flocculans]